MVVLAQHDDVIKWKHFPRYWPFVRGIHRSPVNSPHKGQWRGALMFSLIRVWINGWVNNREAGDLRRYLAHYDVTVMPGNGLVTPSNKLLPELVLIRLSDVIRRQYTVYHAYLNTVNQIILSLLSEYTNPVSISNPCGYLNWNADFPLRRIWFQPG